MSKTLFRILMMAVALVMALAMGTTAYAEGEDAEKSTVAYIFWQDQDWWPAAWAQEDDYWTPTMATVTGPGWYTVKLDAHMPSWFYSGGNSNIGAQKLALVVRDGADLFPGMYMQIVDVRIDGVSYPCGDVTYGTTGYDNINAEEGGKVYWDANDAYAILWDQWMLDNNGGLDDGRTWKSDAVAQKFDVFDVSVLKNPKSIEIDFMLSDAQDVQPEGGPALRTFELGDIYQGEYVKLTPPTPEVPDNATTAHLFYQANNYWPSTDVAGLGEAPAVTITGEGKYTATARFLEQIGDGGWPWTPQGDGAMKFLLVVADGKNGEGTVMDGKYLGVSDVRLNGTSVNIGNAAYGPTGYDDVYNYQFDQNDGYSILYDDYQVNSVGGVLPWGHETWDGSAGTPAVVNPGDIKGVSEIEVDFFVTGTKGELPKEPEPPLLEYEYQWYPKNTMGLVGYSLRDLGITDKWYHVVPVDLTKDGIYKIPMAASNMYLMGYAVVTVQGDDVTVTYEQPRHSFGNFTVNSECVKWFASIDEITDEFCDAPQSDLTFGQTVSKAELGDMAYLFVCNGVTYCLPLTDDGYYPARYYTSVYDDYRAGLDALVAAYAPVEEVPAE